MASCFECLEVVGSGTKCLRAMGSSGKCSEAVGLSGKCSRPIGSGVGCSRVVGYDSMALTTWDWNLGSRPYIGIRSICMAIVWNAIV